MAKSLSQLRTDAPAAAIGDNDIFETTQSGVSKGGIWSQVWTYIKSKLAATEVTYSNATSGLTADNVQEAIDEVTALAVGAGNGDVVGPSSTNDNQVAVMSGTSGKLLANSPVYIDKTTGAIEQYRGKYNLQTGTTYTVQNSDSGKIVDHANAAAISVTLPNATPVGVCCTYVQSGAGQITFAVQGGGGAVLRHADSHTKTRKQWAHVTLHVRSNSNGTSAEWVLAGDTAA